MQNKYVCIATHGSSQAKFWNNPTGWQEVIDYLVSLKYDVVAISKQPVNFKNIIDETGDFPIEKRVERLRGAEFFIGISSGLSWLAWAAKVPVIMISGHSLEGYEFNRNNRRVINASVCHGCWDEFDFDKGNWNWCPRKENTDEMFICTRAITTAQVIDKIDLLLNNNMYQTFDGVYDLELENTLSTNRLLVETNIYKEIFIDKQYDWGIPTGGVGKDDIVIDVGANIGIFSRYADYRGAKKIYAFEPEPKNFELLKQNVTKNCEVYEKAVSNIDGEIELNIDTTMGGHSIILENINNTRTDEFINVASITLDTFIKEKKIKKIDFLKIDCEGGEISVLEGLSDENLKKVQKVAMEYHDMHYHHNNDVKLNLMKRFKDAGFEYYGMGLGRDLTFFSFWRENE